MGNEEGMEKAEEEASPIPASMEKLEDNVRRLHTRLQPVMLESQPKGDSAPEQTGSPMLASLTIVSELITDIHQRLEL